VGDSGWWLAVNLDLALAAVMLTLHLGWILWVIFGAVWTRGRRLLTALHVGSLVWGSVVEIGPWPCPLTLVEQFFETKAGISTYQGGFLVHYLDLVVYPDLPGWLLTAAGVTVCAGNLAIYALRLLRRGVWRMNPGRRR
jgi:Protein of Unknown function (DUF2784)